MMRCSSDPDIVPSRSTNTPGTLRGSEGGRASTHVTWEITDSASSEELTRVSEQRRAGVAGLARPSRAGNTVQQSEANIPNTFSHLIRVTGVQEVCSGVQQSPVQVSLM